jgi:ABC-type sulfate transport system permease subunit
MRLILCIIAAEAMTQLACKAQIFDTLRNKIKETSKFYTTLLECPYCVSVWVATFTVILLYGWAYTKWFIIMLVIHRMSNLLHDITRYVLNAKVDQILKRM